MKPRTTGPRLGDHRAIAHTPLRFTFYADVDLRNAGTMTGWFEAVQKEARAVRADLKRVPADHGTYRVSTPRWSIGTNWVTPALVIRVDCREIPNSAPRINTPTPLTVRNTHRHDYRHNGSAWVCECGSLSRNQ